MLPINLIWPARHQVHPPNHPARDVFTFGFSGVTGCGPIGSKPAWRSDRNVSSDLPTSDDWHKLHFAPRQGCAFNVIFVAQKRTPTRYVSRLGQITGQGRFCHLEPFCCDLPSPNRSVTFLCSFRPVSVGAYAVEHKAGRKKQHLGLAVERPAIWHRWDLMAASKRPSFRRRAVVGGKSENPCHLNQ